MCEYNKMAKYYDLFYRNKSYDNEVKFLTNLIGNRESILDVGCGTGIHMSILEKNGYKVEGLDLNNEMLKIAKTRATGNLYEANLLEFKIDKKYDAIISMFAVFNHLKNYNQLEKGIVNCYQKLNKNGIFIIDLHNGRKDGCKEDICNDCKRIMKWEFDKDSFKEYTKIDYIIDDKVYHYTHEFIIYEIDKLKEVLNKLNLKYELYENYSMNIATNESKNIEIIIYK